MLITELPFLLTPAAQPIHGGRPTLVVPGTVPDNEVMVGGKSLPILGKWTDREGLLWKRFELPATSTESQAGPIAERLDIKVRDESDHVTVGGGLPRIIGDSEPRPGDPWGEASVLSDDLIGPHIETIIWLFDRPAPRPLGPDHDEEDFGLPDPGDSWDHRAHNLAVLPLERFLTKWRSMGLRDEPRLELIARLAERTDLRHTLRAVCWRPRRVLSRQRQLVPAGRVSEVDTTCLRWLARQPGRTTAQKAGPRHQLLAVVRVENVDTPENRVVRDFLVRGIRESTRYLREHERFGGHGLCRRVADFRRLLGGLRQFSAMAEVSPLSGQARANYVLQHDRMYRILWRYYWELVQQEKQRDSAWRWRNRVWSEACATAAMAVAAEHADKAISLRHDIVVHDEQDQGRFLDREGTGISWIARSNGACTTLDFVDGRVLDGYPYALAAVDALKPMCPDFLLTSRPLHSREPSCRVLAVWAILDFDVEKDRLAERVRQLAGAMHAAELPHSVRGLLIQPQRTSAVGGKQEDLVVEGPAYGFRLSVPLCSENLSAANLSAVDLFLDEGLGL